MQNFRHNGKYSQNGEEGVINEVIKRLGNNVKHKIAVEFGAPTKNFCSNIFHLEREGWQCLFYDSDPQESGIFKKMITKDNVNELPDCEIISFDTDGLDYELWEAYNKTPYLVIIEINSGLNPYVDYYKPEHGCNFSIINKLAEKKGYTLLCHTGNNIYIRNDFAHLFPDADNKFTW